MDSYFLYSDSESGVLNIFFEIHAFEVFRTFVCFLGCADILHESFFKFDDSLNIFIYRSTVEIFLFVGESVKEFTVFAEREGSIVIVFSVFYAHSSEVIDKLFKKFISCKEDYFCKVVSAVSDAC